MKLTIELETEEDGRIIAEVVELPGVLVYGQNKSETIAKAQTLFLSVLVDRVEHGEAKVRGQSLSFSFLSINNI